MEPKVTKTQKVVSGSDTVKREKYDPILSIQQAINMATAENRVVRFLTEKSNKEIMLGVVDMKGCALRKPSKEAKEIAVIPPGIEDFCFEKAVDMSIKTSSRIIVPKPRIWLP